MSNQLIPVFQQYFNANGVAEAGLLLHTYETGTLNNKETFQTFGGTANANPIVLDASGYPPEGIYGTGTYRFILKDSEGTTLRDKDQIILTAGLQPDPDGDFTITTNLTVENTMTTGDMVFEANGDAVWTLGGAEVKRIDANGNIAYNGATIPSDVNTGFSFQFWPASCEMKDNATGTSYLMVNCYFNSGSVFKSMINSGARTSFTVLNGAAFDIRGSDADAIAIGQTMTMSIVITPS